MPPNPPMTVDDASRERPSDSAFSYTLLLAMGIGWGLAVSLSKIGALNGGHPVGLALWQVSVSSLLLLAITLIARRPPVLRADYIRFSLICGVVGVSFPAMSLFWAALHLPAGIVAIAFASMPLFTYLLSVLLKVEEADPRRLAGVVIGLAAMLLIILPDSALPGPGLAGWVALTLLASISMSVENVYAGGFRPAGLTSYTLSFGRQFGAVVVLLPAALLTGTALPVAGDWGPVQWAATGTGIISGLAYTVLLFVIARSGPVFASQTAYVVTLAGVGWGMLIFGEQHSVWIWAALALTVAGTALVRPRLPRAVAGKTVTAPGTD